MEQGDDVVIWHNPRCSKSRATLALLEERGIRPRVRRYLDEPPTEDEIRAVLAALGRPAAALLRAKEPEAKALGLGPDSPEEQIIAALAAHPRLIERPVVIRGGRARIGRPPEAVLEILD